MSSKKQKAPAAWFDPIDTGEIGSLDRHGNPNVLTIDIGSIIFFGLSLVVEY